MGCNQSGRCCKLFLINLNKEEYNSKEYYTELQEFGHVEDFKEAELNGANILKQNKDGSCNYLKGKLCSIHLRRPQHCREFFCDSKDPKFKEMIEIVDRIPIDLN